MEETKYYTAKVVLKVEQDSGAIKKVTQSYLVDAVSVTDAEVKVNKKFEGERSDFEITSVVSSNIIEVID